MMYYLQATEEDFKEKYKNGNKRCTPRKAAKLLVNKSNLKDFKFFY